MVNGLRGPRADPRLRLHGRPRTVSSRSTSSTSFPQEERATIAEYADEVDVPSGEQLIAEGEFAYSSSSSSTARPR